MTARTEVLDHDAASAALERTLVNLTSSMANVRGALVAAPDGRALASSLDGLDPRSTAAIVASSRGLGERLAELTGTAALKEIIVHTSDGYLVIYAIADKGALTVLTSSAVNLALLHLRANDLIASLIDVVSAMTEGS